MGAGKALSYVVVVRDKGDVLRIIPQERDIIAGPLIGWQAPMSNEFAMVFFAVYPLSKLNLTHVSAAMYNIR